MAKQKHQDQVFELIEKAQKVWTAVKITVDDVVYLEVVKEDLLSELTKRDAEYLASFIFYVTQDGDIVIGE